MRPTPLTQFELAVSPRSDPAAWTQMEQRAQEEQAGPLCSVLQGLGSPRLQGTPAPPHLMEGLGREQALLPGDIALEGENMPNVRGINCQTQNYSF